MKLKSILTAIIIIASSAAAEEWIELFDGKTTNGWKPNADEGAYEVVDGALKLHATHERNRSHLFYVGDDDELDLFKNFELVIEVKGAPNSNSGIFFHTDMATRDGVLHLANGYEVQLNSTPKERRKTGSLYDVIDLTEAVIDDTKWFTVRIRVEGKRIQVWLNDKQTIDYTEPPNVVAQRSNKRKGRVLNPNGGAIALQAHDEKSVFYFRSIKIRRLL